MSNKSNYVKAGAAVLGALVLMNAGYVGTAKASSTTCSTTNTSAPVITLTLTTTSAGTTIGSNSHSDPANPSKPILAIASFTNDFSSDFISDAIAADPIEVTVSLNNGQLTVAPGAITLPSGLNSTSKIGKDGVVFRVQMRNGKVIGINPQRAFIKIDGQEYNIIVNYTNQAQKRCTQIGYPPGLGRMIKTKITGQLQAIK